MIALVLTGCATKASDKTPCVGGKCDDPGSSAERECSEKCGNDDDCFFRCIEDAALSHCSARREAAFSSRPHFTPNAIRWACADVEGVNNEGGADRGQEYCEYFAVTELPPRNSNGVNNSIKITGKSTGVDPTSETNTSTKQTLSISSNQRSKLEAMSSSDVVGQCVFTSWHQDTPGPLSVCEDPAQCPDVHGHGLNDHHDVSRVEFDGTAVDVSEPLFRMTFEVNSNRAAADLVAECMIRPEVSDDKFFRPDEQQDSFMRGCMVMSPVGQTGLGTEWRRSDSSVCSAAMRLFECGCGVDTDRDGSRDVFDTDAIANLLVPEQPEIDDNGEPVVRMRGFRLGSWNDATKLPSRCRFIDGDEQTVVGCDITVANVLDNAGDLKGFCGQQFGPDVVVHIPLPDGFIVCSEDPSEEFTDTCGSKPWVVGNEKSDGFKNCDHDVCEIGASLDKSCGSCAETVCEQDPFCCEVGWNRFCVEKAERLCNRTCDDVCQSQHSVCDEGEPLDPSCDDCTKAVCEADPFCCVSGWNQLCVAKVEAQCGLTCN